MNVELELRKLIGERYIIQQLYRYQEAINRADFDELARFFGDAKVATVASTNADELHGVIDGGKHFADGFERSVCFYDGNPRVQYSASNPIVQFNEAADQATCHAYYFIFQGLGGHNYGGQYKPEFPLQVIGCGRYLDTWAYDGAAWKMTEREIYSDFSGDYSKHMRLSPAQMAGDQAMVGKDGLTPKVESSLVNALRGPR